MPNSGPELIGAQGARVRLSWPPLRCAGRWFVFVAYEPHSEPESRCRCKLKAAAERVGAASVSEYVEGAVDARIAREQWLACWRAAASKVDPEALAYARRSLLSRVEQRAS